MAAVLLKASRLGGRFGHPRARLLVGNCLWRPGRPRSHPRDSFRAVAGRRGSHPLVVGKEEVSGGKGLGEADTEVNLPAVLCKTPLSVQCSWHKTRNSHSHSLAHSSPHLRDADSRDLSSFPILTQTLHCGSPGEQRRALLGIFQMCLNKHGSGMEWQE